MRTGGWSSEGTRRAAALLVGIALGIGVDRLVSWPGGTRAGGDREGGSMAAPDGGHDATTAGDEGGGLNVPYLLGYLDQVAGAPEAEGREQACAQRRAQMAIAARLSNERYELADRVEKRLEGDARNGRYAAAWLLGEYRLESAIPRLLDHIDLEEHRDCGDTKMPPWRRLPAWEALVKIGSPAIGPAVDRLAGPGDAHRRDLTVRLIHFVEGSRSGLDRLDAALRGEADAARRERLEDAIAHLRAMPQRDP